MRDGEDRGSEEQPSDGERAECAEGGAQRTAGAQLVDEAARERCRLPELCVGIARKVVLRFGEDARPQPARDSHR
jgi:hypothetical protein